MTCQEYLSRLHAYFSLELPAEPAAEVEQHARQCPPCGELMARARELSCRDFVEFLNDYLDATLPAPRQEVFERHLQICSDCTHYLDSYRKTMRMTALELTQGVELPPVPEELIQAILAARRKDP